MPAKKTAKQTPTTTAESDIEKAVLAATFRQIEELVPYARNARTHSEKQVDQIAASIVEFGFTNPVLADEKGIVAGHGRVLGARKVYASGQRIKLPNGIEIPPGTVPVLDCTGWSAPKRKAYVLADNQLALNAGWDEDVLKLELSDLASFEYDMDLIGFDDDELKRLGGTNVHFGDAEADEEVDPPAAPVTLAGDVWLLGRHRIICGDSTNKETVDRVLAGAKPHLMVTDPPYGVEYDPDWRNRADRADGRSPNGRAVGTVSNDDRSDWREAWELFPGGVAYCWHAGLHASNTQLAFEACGFELRSQIIWAKSQFAISRGHYHVQHEPCFYLVRKGQNGHWNGDRTQSTLWEIDKPRKNETGHSTQKPVECMRRPIENNSKPGDMVYEPFSGSGTTIIACEMTGRACLAIELNTAYVDVAVTRWERLTGQAATLEGDGRTFAEVMAERLPPGAVTVEPAKPARGKAAKKPGQGGGDGPVR